MNDRALSEQYKEIISLLDARRLREALIKIEQFLFGTPEWELRSDLEEIRTSYQYMLQYLKQNVADPERRKLYNRLIASSYHLTDRTRILKQMPASSEFYFDRLRYYKLIPLRSLPELQLELETYTEDMAVCNLLNDSEKQEIKLASVRRRHEQAYSDLFYRVWLSERWTEEDENAARNLLSSFMVQINDLSLFISAITLSLMEFFDLRKLMLLLDAYQHSSNEVNQRAIIGITLIIFIYDERLELYPEIASRLKLLNEDVIFANNLNRIQMQLLRSRETKKIDKKMREEIIPEMMKNVNFTTRKLDMDDTDDESSSNDRNPDWQDWAEQSGLSDKLKEMSELQMEGADVYMSTFSQLKTYPFFHNIANWFYPFDTQHSAVTQAFSTSPGKRNLFLDTIFQSGFFCNSDKYSFALTISQIPTAQRDMVAQQFEEQNDALKEAKKYEKLITYSQQAETISNQYIQDLYRFFKIYPRRHEFRDLFEESLNLYYCKTLKTTLNDSNNMLIVAGFLFHKEYYLEALMMYEDAVKVSEGNVEIFQKIGFCYQKNKHYEKAVNAYIQADLLKQDNVWTNRHLAICYRQMKQFARALEYYRKVESVQPENLSIITQIGHCLAELKQFEDALSYFFKLEYLDHESPKARRAIAWCSFVSGKYEQAMRYYRKLLEKKPQLQDFLNAGHVAWATGEIANAAEQYGKALKISNSPEEFITLFKKDKEVLLEHGIKDEDIPLMKDLIWYENDLMLP